MKRVKIDKRDNKPLPAPGKKEYPQPKSPDLPRMFPIISVVAPRGCGKSYATSKLISLYEKDGLYLDGQRVPIRTIIVSPTIETNPQFRSLKSFSEEDCYDFSAELPGELIASVKAEKKFAEDYQRRVILWERVKKTDDPKNFTPEEIAELEMMGWEAPIPEGRYKIPPVNFIVWDDLQGSGAFSNAPRNPVVNMCIKNRHIGICCIYCVQSLRQLPKPIRANTSVWLLFRYNGKTLVEDMYEEVAAVMTKEAFQELYEDVTDKPYHFLVIDETVSPTRLKDTFEFDLVM